MNTGINENGTGANMGTGDKKSTFSAQASLVLWIISITLAIRVSSSKSFLGAYLAGLGFIVGVGLSLIFTIIAIILRQRSVYLKISLIISVLVVIYFAISLTGGVRIG